MSPPLPCFAGLVGLVALVGCDAVPPGTVGPKHPCDSAVRRVDVAPPGQEYGDLKDGGHLWCGNPPQGGAPYTPFRVRFAGPEAFKDGVDLEMIAIDTADGSELAYTTLAMGLTCANVGENAGLWVGSEAHMRYAGFGLDDLDGLEAEIVVRATAQTDPTAMVATSATLRLTLEIE